MFIIEEGKRFKYIACKHKNKGAFMTEWETFGGKTSVYGRGRVQIPETVRKDLKIEDGDEIVWLKKANQDSWFIRVQKRKV